MSEQGVDYNVSTLRWGQRMADARASLVTLRLWSLQKSNDEMDDGRIVPDNVYQYKSAKGSIHYAAPQ